MNAPTQPRHQIRVALVCMPWCSVGIPSLPLAILKARAAQIGVSADVYHLNIRFAELIGFRLYEHIALTSATHPEWFFSVPLFAQSGSSVEHGALEKLKDLDDGEAFVAALVRNTTGSQEGCEKVSACAAQFVHTMAETIPWMQYDVVGFTVTHAQVCSSLLMAKLIKQSFPSTHIVFGGAAAQGEMGLELLEHFDWIDHMVHGEGERSFIDLLEAIRDGELLHINGVSSRIDNSLFTNESHPAEMWNMAQSPIPDHSEYFAEVRRTHLDRYVPISLSVEASRGCWWGAKHLCTFCGLNGPTLTYRSKPASQFINELTSLSTRHNMLSFLACDTILDPTYYRDLLPRLADLELDLSMFFEVKSNLTRSQVALLANAGLTRLQPGIEALNTPLLKLMNKGVTAPQNIAFMKWAAEYGISLFWNILHGFPGETPEHYSSYPDLFRMLMHLQPPVDVCPITFERYSPYHVNQRQYNLSLEPLKLYDFLFPQKVNKQRIAYFFEDDRHASGARNLCSSVLERTRIAFREWRGAWDTQRVSFSYEKGPDFIILRDTRPLASGSELLERRTILRGLPARVFCLCDEPRSRNALLEALIKDGYEKASLPDRVDNIIKDFTRERFIYRDDERILALATRRRSTRTHLKLRSKEQPSPFNVLS